MRKDLKEQLVRFILLLCVLFGGTIIMSGCDFAKVSADKYETNRYEINEDFENVSVIADTADIVLMPSEGSDSVVVCYERKNARHSVAVKEDTLLIEVMGARKWYERLGINFGTPQITVYLPAGEYGALSVRSSTGDAAEIFAKTETGHVTGTLLSEKIFIVNTETGKKEVPISFVGGRCEITTVTGNIKIAIEP